MAVTQADIDALNTAIASGVKSVTLRGKTVVYGDIAGLIAARDDMKRQLASQASALSDAPPKRSRRLQAYFAGRGY